MTPEEAWAVVLAHRPALERLAHRLASDAPAVGFDELLSEVTEGAYRGALCYEAGHGTALKSWMLTKAGYGAKDFMRFHGAALGWARKRQWGGRTVVSLEQVAGELADRYGDAGDTSLPIEDPNAQRDFDHFEGNELLKTLLDRLPHKEAGVLRLHFLHGYLLKDIGELLGVTESRACQIKVAALSRCRQLLEAAS